MDKKYLEKLLLSWSQDAKDHFTNSLSEMDILGKLQPAKYLKMLYIYGYRGTRFPKWVGDPSYHNLTELSLSGCQNCCILPPLGQLRSLKDLTIGQMSMLETFGSEYGDSFSGTLFPSLECLVFRDMPCLKIWHQSQKSDDSFPLLEFLSICECPILQGDFPSYLPALVFIQIEQCVQLSSSLPRSPAIHTLYIRESNNVPLHELSLSLEELIIQGKEVTKVFFEAIAITPSISLKKLVIEDCWSVISFPGDFLPLSLESLSITNFRNLNFPNQSDLHESLKDLSIDCCDSLTTLPLETLPNLCLLNIKNCENIECVSASKIHQNLTEFEISNCPKFVSFPREGLSAPNLTSLHVSNCVKLKSLPCHANTCLPKLQEVYIYECPKMDTFPEGGMPRSLRSLHVRNCKKLLKNPSLTSMDMLTRLTVDGPCDGIESFPNKGFVLLPPSLTSLHLRKFSSLHTLECMGLLHLTSLQQLYIEDCPKLETIEGERLPASLIKLEISGCPLLEERCRMKHLQIWPKISHIRGINVDGNWI